MSVFYGGLYNNGATGEKSARYVNCIALLAGWL